MTSGLVRRLWALSFLTAYPSPARPAPSFDCKLAHSEVEQLICSDDTLAALDRDQVAGYERLRQAVSPAGAALLLAQQRAWLASRPGCVKGVNAGIRSAQIECLTQAYQDGSTAPAARFRQAGGLMLEDRESVRRIPRLRVGDPDTIINLANPEDDEGWLFNDDGAVLLGGRGERSMAGDSAEIPIPYDVLAPDSPLPAPGHP